MGKEPYWNSRHAIPEQWYCARWRTGLDADVAIGLLAKGSKHSRDTGRSSLLRERNTATNSDRPYGRLCATTKGNPTSTYTLPGTSPVTCSSSRNVIWWLIWRKGAQPSPLRRDRQQPSTMEVYGEVAITDSVSASDDGPRKSTAYVLWSKITRIEKRRQLPGLSITFISVAARHSRAAASQSANSPHLGYQYGDRFSLSITPVWPDTFKCGIKWINILMLDARRMTLWNLSSSP